MSVVKQIERLVNAEATRLRKLIREQGRGAQARVARESGVSVVTMSRFMSGSDESYGPDFLDRIAQVLKNDSVKR